jgi:hypothetical protein
MWRKAEAEVEEGVAQLMRAAHFGKCKFNNDSVVCDLSKFFFFFLVTSVTCRLSDDSDFSSLVSVMAEQQSVSTNDIV